MYLKPYDNYKYTDSRWGIEDVAGVDRGRTEKKIFKAGATALNVASTAGQAATGYTGVALVTGAVAVAAGPVGVVAAGGLLTVGSTVFAARSAYKTYKHGKALEDLYNRRMQFDCRLILQGKHPLVHAHEFPRGNLTQHGMVADEVLPYIISKKDAKFKRKAASAVPGVGVLETVRAVGKNAYKRWWTGTLGRNRTHASQWLAVHLITHDCHLANAIVAELYSDEEMQILRTFDSDKLLPFLMDKMRST